MISEKEQIDITYIGPVGADFGFRLSGINTVACSSSDELVKQLKQLRASKQGGIVFVDEGLAEDVLDQVEALNEDTLPAIMLLTNPSNPKRLAARKMDNLVVKAVGSDILGK
jgi:vacuolar-type H+-ATPase subunit F/Vma7